MFCQLNGSWCNVLIELYLHGAHSLCDTMRIILVFFIILPKQLPRLLYVMPCIPCLTWRSNTTLCWYLILHNYLNSVKSGFKTGQDWKAFYANAEDAKALSKQWTSWAEWSRDHKSGLSKKNSPRVCQWTRVNFASLEN